MSHTKRDMAQEVLALKTMSLGSEEDGRKDENVDPAKSRRNPLLRYDQVFVPALTT